MGLTCPTCSVNWNPGNRPVEHSSLPGSFAIVYREVVISARERSLQAWTLFAVLDAAGATWTHVTNRRAA